MLIFALFYNKSLITCLEYLKFPNISNINKNFSSFKSFAFHKAKFYAHDVIMKNLSTKKNWAAIKWPISPDLKGLGFSKMLIFALFYNKSLIPENLKFPNMNKHFSSFISFAFHKGKFYSQNVIIKKKSALEKM